MMKKLLLCMAALAMTGMTACNDSEALKQDCANGEQKCARHSVWLCTDGTWLIEKVCQGSEVCNETTLTCEASVRLCDEGTKRCEANNVEICTDNAWAVETSCIGATVCNAATFVCDATVVTCDDGAKRCQANNVEICANNAWTIETSCIDVTVCNAATFVCDPTVVTCNGGETKCTVDGKLNTCNGNTWTVSDCDAGQVCVNGKTACENKVCDEGSTLCNVDNDATIICTDNAKVETACTGATAVCEDGECVACLNGEKRCENNAIEVCVANLWTEELACGAKVCNDTSYTCDPVSTCTAGWERCNVNVVERCTAGQFVPVSPAACAAGSLCLADTNAHTATCVECKNNLDCKTTKAPICHSDNTCVACTPMDKKCHESNGTFILCGENGAWKTSGTTCEGGQTCLPGGKDCTNIVGYCDGNADCKDSLHTECVDHLCTCFLGQKTCKVEDGQAKYSVCSSFGFGWDPYANCAATTPVCNDAKTQCVECTNNTHCKGETICNLASNKCVAAGPEWDHLVNFEGCDATTSYGAVTCTSGISFTSALRDSSNAIEGASIRMNKNSSATLTVPKGVGKLSIDVKKVYGQTANVTIKVGGVAAITRLNMAPDTLETMVNDAVNASGPVDIVISTTQLIVIDNLKWTNHP